MLPQLHYLVQHPQCTALAPVEDFWKMTKEIVPDPLNTKQQFRIPLRALLPLKEIVISRIADILNPGGTHIIDTSSLGNCSMRVENRNKIALNRLTCLLCKPDMSTKEIMKINKTTPMSEVDRKVSRRAHHGEPPQQKYQQRPLRSPLQRAHNRGNAQKIHGHSEY